MSASAPSASPGAAGSEPPQRRAAALPSDPPALHSGSRPQRPAARAAGSRSAAASGPSRLRTPHSDAARSSASRSSPAAPGRARRRSRPLTSTARCSPLPRRHHAAPIPAEPPCRHGHRMNGRAGAPRGPRPPSAVQPERGPSSSVPPRGQLRSGPRRPPLRPSPPRRRARPAAPRCSPRGPPAPSFVAAGARRQRMGATEAPEPSSGRLLPPPASRAPRAERSAAQRSQRRHSARGRPRPPGMALPRGARPRRARVSPQSVRPTAAAADRAEPRRTRGQVPSTAGRRPSGRPVGSFGARCAEGSSCAASGERRAPTPLNRARPAARSSEGLWSDGALQVAELRRAGLPTAGSGQPGLFMSRFYPPVALPQPRAAQPRGTFPLGAVGRCRGGAAPGAGGRTERRSTAGGLGGSARR